jgi:hypothetical protein
MNNFNNFIYNNNTAFDYNDCKVDDCLDSQHVCSMMKEARPICDKLKKKSKDLDQIYNLYNNQIQNHMYEVGLNDDNNQNYTHRHHDSNNNWYSACTTDQCQDNYHPCSMMGNAKKTCNNFKNQTTLKEKKKTSKKNSFFNKSEELNNNSLRMLKTPPISLEKIFSISNSNTNNLVNIQSRLDKLLETPSCKVKDVDGKIINIPDTYPGDHWTYNHLMKDKTYPVNYYSKINPEKLVNKYSEYNDICKKKRTQKKVTKLNNLSVKKQTPKHRMVPERLFDNYDFIKMFGMKKSKKRY